MDLTKVLEQLRQELEYIDAAILSLERLQSRERRRGRPPRSLLAKLKPTAVERPLSITRKSRRGRQTS
jgi:hypothetical protein